MSENTYKKPDYANLSDMLSQGPVAMRSLIEVGRKEGIKVEVAAAAEDKKPGTVETIQAERGMVFRHKKRGTLVTILRAAVDTSKSGSPVHLVVESRTGNEFKALERNLERP